MDDADELRRQVADLTEQLARKTAEAEEYRRDVTVLRAKHIDVVGWMLTAWSRMEQGERWLLTRIVPCDVLNADLAGARAF